MVVSDFIFAASSGFLIGLFSANFNVAYAGVLLCVTVSLYFRKRIGIIFILFAAFGIGFFYFYLYGATKETAFVYDRTTSFAGTVESEPKFTEKTQIISVQPNNSVNSLQVMTRKSPVFHYGDDVFLDGVTTRSESGDPAMYFPQIQLHNDSDGFYLKRSLIGLKQRIIEFYKSNMSGDAGALLSGIIFGDQSGFSKDLKKQMAASGTTHLVALSGYNIAIIVDAAAITISSFLSRKMTFAATAVLILLFIIMVGAQASVVRAAVMGFLALAARNAGRMYDFRNSIAFTAAIMSIFDPHGMKNDLGFILSFVSLMGIAYLSPLFQRKSETTNTLGWRNIFAETMSAQIAVAPILVVSFNSFSVAALPANILILSVMPLLMFLGFALAFAGITLVWFSFPLVVLTHFLLSYALLVIKTFSFFRPSIYVSGSAFVIGYYLVLVGFLVFYAQRRAQRI